MNTVKSLIALALTAVMLNGFAVVVAADEASAEANASAECEVGDYGQDVNCKVDSEAKASVLTRDGETTHEVVDTGLGAQGIALAVGTVTTGAAAAVTKFRLGK
jgi:hypothetical protein